MAWAKRNRQLKLPKLTSVCGTSGRSLSFHQTHASTYTTTVAIRTTGQTYTWSVSKTPGQFTVASSVPIRNMFNASRISRPPNAPTSRRGQGSGYASITLAQSTIWSAPLQLVSREEVAGFAWVGDSHGAG